MLEQFRDSQPVFTKYLEEVITNTKKISHAYLIETNSFPKSKELVFAFAKILLCPDALKHSENDECHICHLIDQGKYSDLQIIESSGSWIKKEQLLDLQKELKTKSVVGGRRVYIIFQAEKLNVSSANTLLKFLEEPEENIIAILVTVNRYQVIETLLSRCQILSLFRSDNQIAADVISETLLSFLEYIYRYGVETIAYINRFFLDLFQDKEQTMRTLNQLENIYVDLLENQVEETFLIQKYGQAIEKIIGKISLSDIVEKLKVIDQFKQKLQYNVNMKLWLDYFVISFCKGGKEHV